MKDFQQAFLDEIVAKFKKRSEAVRAIASILDIGDDAIYKRLRGDSSIYPNEIAALAIEFEISIDKIISNIKRDG